MFRRVFFEKNQDQHCGVKLYLDFPIIKPILWFQSILQKRKKNLAEGYMEMSKFEKRLCIFAIVFVVIYIAAMVITIHSRVSNPEKITRIESAEPGEGESQMMLAELFLPMAIFFTVTICFIMVKNKRSKAVLEAEETDEDYP